MAPDVKEECSGAIAGLFFAHCRESRGGGASYGARFVRDARDKLAPVLNKSAQWSDAERDGWQRWARWLRQVALGQVRHDGGDESKAAAVNTLTDVAVSFGLPHLQ
jgi:hypothetical protein|tara:strand:+ start:204 stop:521 length:318 start_codon:yes stop_codon:yes gene_type:complete